MFPKIVKIGIFLTLIKKDDLLPYIIYLPMSKVIFLMELYLIWKLFVIICSFVFFLSINTMDNMQIVVKTQDGPVNTLLIFAFLSILIVIILSSITWKIHFT